MSRDDWYRQTEWSQEKSAAFFDRLARSGTSLHRAQYLRIQASTLADTGTPGNIGVALELVTRLLQEYPKEFDIPLAHLQAAGCHDALGNVDAAIHHFEAGIATLETRPNLETGVALEYAWFIVRHALVDRYPRALSVLASVRTVFPCQRFRESATRALLADHYGERAAAQASARAALDAAALKQSPFHRHPTVGLVTAGDRAWLERLTELASA